jgi:hypothetical protein
VTRFACLIFLSMLLTGSGEAIAEAPAKPAPASKDCVAPADWAPSEQFVWQQVCAGADADFNEGSTYGGDLNPGTPDGWGMSRAISSRFLETILLKDPYRSFLTRRGVVIIGAYFPDRVDLESASLQHPLVLKKSRFENDVDLQWVSSTSLIDLGQSKVVGIVRMNGAQINADLNLNDRAAFAAVKLEGARIAGSVDFGWSSVSAGLSFITSHIGQALYLNEGGKFSGLIDLSFATIGESLDFSEGTFESDIKLAGAEIGSLYFGSTKDTSANPDSSTKPAVWLNNLQMNLHNAKAGVIPGLADIWPPRLNLSGFSYQSLNDPDAPTPSQITDWFGKQAGYSAQPYEQLALVLQNHGAAANATFARYLGREQERATSTGWRYAWLSTLNWFVGYGYYPVLAIFPTLLMIGLGVVMLRVSRQGPANGMPYGVTYSFDMLLPLIKLREKHYQMELQGWVRYYFYFHKIAGWLLASFLVGGISGLTK